MSTKDPSSKRQRREVGNDEYAAFTRRILRSMGKRVAEGDIGSLSDLVALQAEVDATLQQTVDRLRSDPWNYSWAEIGAELGVTRQAAQKRWGPKGHTRKMPQAS